MNLNGARLPFQGRHPEVAESAWIAPGATVVGSVKIGEQASVWYAAVLRGDTEPITVGDRTKVQDRAVMHADPGYPAIVGADCVVGHKAILHGCTVEDRCLIGMNATVLNGARIGAGSVVGAGAVVPEGREFGPRSLILGIPAKQVGQVGDEQLAEIERGARGYVERAAAHRASLAEEAASPGATPP